MVAQAGRRLLGPVVAVAVVVIVIVLLIFINGHPDTSSHLVSRIHPVSSRSGSDTPSRRKAHPTSPARSRATSMPGVHPSRRHAAASALAPVAVLNNSRRSGLARYVSGELQTRGWDVYYFGNLQGRVLVPTAYYAPGDRPAAAHLAREFPGVQRVLPDAELGLHTRGVTLVLTESWTG